MSQAPVQNEGSIITHVPEARLPPAYSPGVLSQQHTYFPFLSLFSILCTPCIVTLMNQFGNAIVLHSKKFFFVFHTCGGPPMAFTGLKCFVLPQVAFVFLYTVGSRSW